MHTECEEIYIINSLYKSLLNYCEGLHLVHMSYENQFDCVIPAAGLSARMGSWKPMTDYFGQPMILHIVEKTLKVCRRIILVTGHRGNELETFFAPYEKVSCVRNPDYRQGMFRSIQTGAQLVTTDWFFITLGDMPAIPGRLFTKLANEIDEHPSVDIIRPVYRNQPGHPVLLKRSVAAAISRLEPAADMQMVFKVHRENTGRGVYELSVDTPGSIYDVDTNDDLLKPSASFSGGRNIKGETDEH